MGTVALTVESQRSATLTVSEIFGPTVQGEGPSAGRRCAFVRLGRCDLTCAWCDTPYTWDWRGVNGRRFDPADELEDRPIAHILELVDRMAVDRVVITGGEPLLQRRSLTKLVEELQQQGRSVEIETNGRHRPLSIDGVQYNVSPKLASSGVDASVRLRADSLDQLAAEPNSIFKFVCSAPADLEEVAAIVERHAIAPDRVWISPLGTTPSAIEASLRSVADDVVERGWNLSSRLHVLAWGDARGR
ncbi:MAG: 7-carboxy-7-deazaguanine synthase QueE [Acidimicrobiales bacterium]